MRWQDKPVLLPALLSCITASRPRKHGILTSGNQNSSCKSRLVITNKKTNRKKEKAKALASYFQKGLNNHMLIAKCTRQERDRGEEKIRFEEKVLKKVRFEEKVLFTCLTAPPKTLNARMCCLTTETALAFSWLGFWAE